MRGMIMLHGFFLAAAHAHASAEVNVLFVLVDDTGHGDLGANGGADVPIPNLDRLAREGTRFTRFSSASPICSASRRGLDGLAVAGDAQRLDWIAAPAGA